jgi:hypothetical protein
VPVTGSGSTAAVAVMPSPRQLAVGSVSSWRFHTTAPVDSFSA